MSTVLLDDRPAFGGLLAFTLPDALAASEPPEARGVARDGVRLLVARGDGTLEHTTFRSLPAHLRPGDLLVVNTSATLPAAVPTTDGGLLHLSGQLPGGLWLVEARRRAGAGWRPDPRRPAGTVGLAGGVTAQLLAPFMQGSDGVRLWVAALDVPGPVLEWLGRHGEPIRYPYVSGRWPLAAYQTVFATEPGSAEMPSAARGFTPRLVTELVAHGVGIAPLVLHTGVSSPEEGEPPYPERYRVPEATADAVNATRSAGRRVIAVGTTVTRALETVADERGRAHPGGGWTDLVITPQRGVRVVDGLLTGWHAPAASHLALLEAVAGRPLLERSYAAALDAGYRWHEFGDLHLLLP